MDVKMMRLEFAAGAAFVIAFPALVGAVAPRVAVMNNGARKGASVTVTNSRNGFSKQYPAGPKR